MLISTIKKSLFMKFTRASIGRGGPTEEKNKINQL